MTNPRDFRPEQNFFAGGGCRRLLELGAYSPPPWQAAVEALAAQIAGSTRSIRAIDFSPTLEDHAALAAIACTDPTVFVIADVLHRLADPRPLLATLRRMLRANPGNRLLAVTPDRDRVGAENALPPNPGHTRLWTKSEFLRAMEAAGFEVLRAGWLPDDAETIVYCEAACSPAYYQRFLRLAGLPPPAPHLVLTTEPPGSPGPIGHYLQAAASPRLTLLAGGASESCIALTDFGGAGAEPDEFFAAVLQLLFLYDDITLIEYQDTGGIGLRVAQAKRAGMIAPHVTVLAYAHGNGIAADEAAGVIDRTRPPKRSAAERLSVELADIAAFPSPARQKLYGRAGITPRAILPPHPADAAEKKTWQAKMADFLSATPPVAPPASAAVTILLTNFNGTPQYLADAATSIRNATLRPAHVILVDDGSTARNFAHLEQMAQSLDGRPAEIIRHDQNRGAAAARNTGLARIETPYFCAHDNDNIMLNRFLEIACRMLEENPNLAAVTSWMHYFEDGADWRAETGVRNDYRPLGADLGICMSDNVIGDNFAVYRTAAVREIGGWDEFGRGMWEDWQLLNRLIAAGRDVWTIPAALTLHRNRPGSITGTHSQFGGWLLIARSLPGLPYGQAISLMQSLWHAAPVPPPPDTQRMKALETELAELRLIAASTAWRLTRQLLTVLENIPLFRTIRRARRR